MRFQGWEKIMYEFVTGPLAWLAFTVFFVGLMIRMVLYVKGLDWQLDRVTYRVNVRYGVTGAARSIFYWILPFGSRSWRDKPVFTLVSFTFHLGLVITPVCLLAHNMILKERWGISFWTLSETAADALTLVVMLTGFFLILRRIALPEVRILTTAYDYLLMAIALMPFITGFVAFHQVSDYPFWLIAHIISGEIMLMAIPFTKLSHMVLFFFSRAQLGMDYGIKRGGMKGRGIAW
jgi:nitrate reductase gamma subunit